MDRNFLRKSRRIKSLMYALIWHYYPEIPTYRIRVPELAQLGVILVESRKTYAETTSGNCDYTEFLNLLWSKLTSDGRFQQVQKEVTELCKLKTVFLGIKVVPKCHYEFTAADLDFLRSVETHTQPPSPSQ